MKAIISNSLKQIIPAGIVIMFALGCERDIANLEPASYSDMPEVFIDGFSQGLNYAAFGGSLPTAFDVDEDVTYNNSKASMKFEVPDYNDPRGGYAGGVFFTSEGRDLSAYNALTFYARSSQPATIDLVGFGNDLGESNSQVSLSALKVTTNWNKFIIPIPDPSKLKSERGMLFYSEGPEDERGYTFWIDEVKFEKLGTIAYPQPAILLGQDQVISTFEGVSTSIGGISSTFNLPNGVNTQVNLAASYFEFSSSNEAIATVDVSGKVTVTGGPGTAVITAKMGLTDADGSLTIQSGGTFQHAPVPTHSQADVISLFSDSYTNVPVDYYNGYWAPYQTTQSADFEVNGDNILHYTNFNFVGVQFSSPTINASSMTHLKVNIFIPNALAGGTQFKIQLVNFGADGVYGGGNDSSHTLTFTAPTLVAQSWITFDIPLSSFTGLTARANLGQLIFEGSNISSFYADNIYFHK
ncbi:MAG: glycosyl hydrolase family 16 [Bacteroidales bacterium]|nr:glycosyl hydrolase family 16 [Bacteroidales bacterium]